MFELFVEIYLVIELEADESNQCNLHTWVHENIFYQKNVLGVSL